MLIGNTFHNYSINQAIQAVQAADNPEEKPATTDRSHHEQNTQSQSNNSNLDSLGKGNLI